MTAQTVAASSARQEAPGITRLAVSLRPWSDPGHANRSSSGQSSQTLVAISGRRATRARLLHVVTTKNGDAVRFVTSGRQTAQQGRSNRAP